MAPKAASSRKRSRPLTVKSELPSPETLQKTAKEMEFMRTSAQILKVEKPEDWPEECILNPRAFAPLPEGWYHAKKMTKSSSRGSGGKLHQCFVGPGGKFFWHKKDLEKFLGKKIEMAKGVRRPRSLAPAAVQEFPPDAIIRRTDKKTECEYIQARVDALDGKTIFEALQKFNYECNGMQYEYRLGDLRYDICYGRLVIEGTQAKSESPGASSTLKRKAASSSSLPTSRSQKAPSTPAQKAPSTPAQKAPPTPTSSCRSRSVSKRPAASPASLMAEEAKTPQSTLQAISKSVLAPLKQRAATGQGGEKDILTLLGVGQQLAMDATMLRVLPEVLRKTPADRGEFGNVVLAQFEAALHA